MSCCELVILDMDHTLTESEFLYDVWLDALTEFGATVSQIEAAHRQGTGHAAMVTIRVCFPDRPEVWAPAAERFQQLCNERARFVALPGADDALRELHAAGLILALSTGAPQWVAEAVMNEMGWSPLMSFVLGSSETVTKADHVDQILNATALPADRIASVGDGVAEMAAAALHDLRWRIGLLSSNGVNAADQYQLLSDAGATEVLSSIAAVPRTLLNSHSAHS
jgi:phosphoglycolate phosphatase-like HAD superfamily hydrolase